jgi:hypothetical protein
MFVSEPRQSLDALWNVTSGQDYVDIITGFAARPGIDVLPTCSTEIAMSATALQSDVFSVSNRRGQPLS